MEMPGRAGGGVPSSTMRNGPRYEARAVEARSTANACPRRPGPAVRSRSRRALTRRGARASTSSPSSGAAARSSTAFAALARSADRVHAPVVAVAEIHVERARRGRTSSALRGVRPRNAWLPGSSSARYASTSTRRAETPLPTSTLLSSSGRDVERVAVEERRGQCVGREPRLLTLHALAGLVELRGDRLGTGAARRGAPAHRAARLEEHEEVGTEARVVRDQLLERHAALDRLAHDRADDRVRLAERRALAHQVLGDVGGGVERAVGAGGHRGVDEGRGRHEPGERAQRQRARVERVEQRLLVLLQIAVVRERQRLQRREEAGEVADEPAGLAPRQLGDVGVLLLRQHRRTGRVRVGEPHESELVGRPQHDLFAESRQVHLGQRGDEQRLGDEVAIGDGVERVLERARRTRARPRPTPGSSGRLEPASAPAPSGETSAAGQAVVPAVDVAGQRPEVREQMVREQHRLGPLHVRVAGERDLGRLPRPLQQHALQLVDPRRDRHAPRAADTAACRARSGRCGCGRCAAWPRPRPRSR